VARWFVAAKAVINSLARFTHVHVARAHARLFCPPSRRGSNLGRVNMTRARSSLSIVTSNQMKTAPARPIVRHE
jgi:hypothetical protein